MLTIFDNFDHFQQSWQFLTIFTIFDNLNNFWQFWHILTILTIFTIFCNFDKFKFLLQFLTIGDNFHNSDNCFCHFDNWKDNPGDLWHLRHWLQFWQLRTWIHDIFCYMTINCDTGQHSQFLRCFRLEFSSYLPTTIIIIFWWILHPTHHNHNYDGSLIFRWIFHPTHHNHNYDGSLKVLLEDLLDTLISRSNL